MERVERHMLRMLNLRQWLDLLSHPKTDVKQIQESKSSRVTPLVVIYFGMQARHSKIQLRIG